MNRDVRILRKLAYFLSAPPQIGRVPSSDLDRLQLALLKTANEIHEEDVQRAKDQRADEDAYSEACAADSPFNPDSTT